MSVSKKQKQKISRAVSSSDIEIIRFQQTLNNPFQTKEISPIKIKPELLKYRYYNNIMRNLEEVKISWGLSSNENQLRTTKIREKLSELLHLIKK